MTISLLFLDGSVEEEEANHVVLVHARERELVKSRLAFFSFFLSFSFSNNNKKREKGIYRLIAFLFFVHVKFLESQIFIGLEIQTCTLITMETPFFLLHNNATS